MSNRLLKLSSAAELVDVRVDTVRKWVALGWLVPLARTVGKRRAIRVREGDVLALFAEVGDATPSGGRPPPQRAVNDYLDAAGY